MKKKKLKRTPKLNIICDSSFENKKHSEEEIKFRRKKHKLIVEEVYNPNYQFDLEQLARQLNKKDENWEQYSEATKYKNDDNEEQPKEENIQRSDSKYVDTDWKPKTVAYGKPFNILKAKQNYDDKDLTEIIVESCFNPVKLTVKTFNMYRKVYALILYFERIRSADPNRVTVLPIAQTQKSIIRLFGSQQNVSNVLKFAKKIGLIQVYNENYVYVSESTWYKEWWREHTYAKEYFWFKNVEDNIRQFCRYNNILPWTKEDNKKPAVFELPEWMKAKLIISSNITGVKKPEDMSEKEFIESVKEVLIKKYPIYTEIRETVDNINNTDFYKQHPELQLIAEFNIHLQKKHLKKIGFRITNLACNIPKEKKTRPSIMYENREAMLYALGLLGINHDVKSSIPRVMYLLSHGEWLSEDVDIYGLIYEQMCKNNETFKNQYPAFTETLRNLFKKLFMSINFSKTKTQAANSIYRDYAKCRDEQEEEYLKELIRSNYGEFYAIKINNKYQIYKLVEEYYNALQQVIGFTSSSEIFMHESAIYLNVLKRLTNHNVHTYQCYDAIYTNCHISEQAFKNLIKDEALKYYDKYKNNITFTQLITLQRKSVIDMIYNNELNEYSYTNSYGITHTFTTESFMESLLDLSMNNTNLIVNITNYTIVDNSILNNVININLTKRNQVSRVKCNSSTSVIHDMIGYMIKKIKDKRKKIEIMSMLRIMDIEKEEN